MNDITPTIDLLCSRDPTYFNKVRCFFCNQTQESIDHLATCASLSSTWHNIITSAVTYTTKKLNKKWNANIGSTSIIIHIKDNDNLSSPFNNRLAWLRGLIPANFNSVLRKHRLSPNKLNNLAHTIRKKILSEFKTDIWLPRCEYYKKWMETQPCTYKQYCLNKQRTPTHRRQSNTAITPQPDPDNLDPDDTDSMQPTFKLDHKHRTILTAHDKKNWATNITSTIIRDHINGSSKCQWKINNTKIKSMVRSRKTDKSTTDIHLTDRAR